MMSEKLTKSSAHHLLSAPNLLGSNGKTMSVPSVSVKPAAFQAVNGNSSVHHASPVAPKFTISRGTQVHPGGQHKPIGPKNPSATSPPVAPKPVHLSTRPSPKSPPPVPPKPSTPVKPGSKPTVAPKPSLPPKPLTKGSVLLDGTASAPSRPQRSQKLASKLPHLDLPFSNIHQTQKSFSLGRLEGIRCSALLSGNIISDQTDDALYRHDSGAVYCSLEHDATVQPFRLHPVAPPRRRRKSAGHSVEPIYAVVDFSKKRNRRPLDMTSSEPAHGKAQIEENTFGNRELDRLAPNQCPTKDAAVQREADLTLDSDILVIERSYATITSIMASFAPTSTASSAKRPDSEPAVVVSKATTPKLSDNQTGGKGGESETNSGSKATISRLVFGGAVVEQSDLVPAGQSGGNDKPAGLKEFKDTIALPQISFETPFALAHSNDTSSPHRLRQPSPTPSLASSCSSAGNDEVNQPGKHFDPDGGSAGTLGDIDSSDVTRQSSVDDDSVSSAVGLDPNKEKPFGFRRTFDSLLSSLGKSSSRKGHDKRKMLDLDKDSSSTDAEVDQLQRHLSVNTRQHLCVTRTVPVAASSGSFIRDARVCRSVQSGEKIRASSLDARIIGALDGPDAATQAGCNSFDSIGDSPETKSMPPSGLTCPNDGQAACREPVIDSHASPEEEKCKSEGRHNFCISHPYLKFVGHLGKWATVQHGSEYSRPSSSRIDSDSEEDSVCHWLHGKERKAFYTAREICSSERVFVDCLRLICIDFRAAITEAGDAREGPVIPDAELNRILSYLPHLKNLNEELLNDFEMRLARWSSDPKIADVIIRKGPFLKLYSAYIRDFQSQSNLLDDCVQKYPRFGMALKRFEQSPRCKNLSLKVYLLKPVQRLPQYRLLLEGYLKTLDENGPDFDDTIAALKVVTDVAEHANNSIKHLHEFQKLMRLQCRLGNCEIIKPGRYIVKEGELDKVSRKTLQPRYFILLNDSLLCTSYLNSSPSAACSLKLHHELPLSRMEIQLPACTTALESGIEFNVITTTRSFTLSALSTEHRDDWLNALRFAIDNFHSKQSSFPTNSAALENEIRLGQQAPVWIPDSRVTMCQLCTAAFSMTFRRHHCRCCGRVICRNCSSRKSELEYLNFRSARVCDDCFLAIKGSGEGSSVEPTSSCSSTIEPDVSTTLVTVTPIHAFTDEDMPTATDSIVPLPSQGSASNLRRDNVMRKERRYIPQRLIEVSANDTDSQMSGYLSRRCKKSWKKNWFVLKDRVLYIYKASEDVVALDTIPVLGYHVKCEDEDVTCFQLFHPKQSPIVFQAESAVLAQK